ncbi:hypothetical protein BD324DRAFT_59611 [Kockovaella imperatae]|uniref:D-serine dehydratase n=1 Tax=Kockovaella imperatae TaxID=4999 RepID=A0A1Y1UDE5_9TREE|nr:hypothetical protein BD324DRAFT_59611 [Kockovaella imperatae]ORX35544.1 hypothetical protein BD324DRAFT_59611 [Kockovaella imperatae]
MSKSKSIASTFTPLSLLTLPDKKALQDEFVGRDISSLRTPALILDRTKFKQNCERVTSEAKRRDLRFRAHVKTHKTSEGVRLQVQAGGGVRALVCSTMPEVWQVVASGVVHDGLVDDILYSLPIGEDKLEDLNDVQEKVGNKAIVRLMIDHPAQVEAIQRFSERFGRNKPWSVFIKVDGGGKRAGLPPQSQQMKELVEAVLACSAVSIFGFYSHFGQSYASKSLDNASDYFKGEIECVNSAAQVARSLGAKGDWILSVGATPTAHAAVQETHQAMQGLEGALELHAGNYCVCDLQQYATSLVAPTDLALTVIARVVSLYPHRNEAMCDCGALAVSKDTGPFEGFGHVISPPHATAWDLGRISQEHGTLTHRPKSSKVGDTSEQPGQLNVGDVVRIVPQHACLVCAGHPWIYVVEDGGETVVDVWVPWKGW